MTEDDSRHHIQAPYQLNMAVAYVVPTEPGLLLVVSASSGDATIVYLACTCWDADFMDAVVDKLKRDSPKLQWVISSENLETVSCITPPRINESSHTVLPLLHVRILTPIPRLT